MKIITMHVYDKPVPPVNMSVEIGLPLSNIIMKLMEKSPDNRYQGYAELANDLKVAEEACIRQRTLSKVA